MPHDAGDLDLDPETRERLQKRFELLRAGLQPLREAAEGEEPLFDWFDLLDLDSDR